MDFLSKLSILLRELPQPVVTDYDLYREIFREIAEHRYSDIKIPIRVISKNRIFHQIITPLCQRGILALHSDFPIKRVYEIIGNKPQEAADITCSVDPFAYISHLSAMEYHGLTNRSPKILFISTPDSKAWKNFAREKMTHDCGDFFTEYVLQYRLPSLTRIDFDSIKGTKINRYASVHQGAFKNIEERKLRVSTIGRTFLDMLRKPDYCGGMRHIMDIYSEHGKYYHNLIIDEVERHGNAIEKVRAGFLLENFSGIKDPKIEAWLKYVQRGGSRKLDPNNPYKETYDERWCISLNTE